MCITLCTTDFSYTMHATHGNVRNPGFSGVVCAKQKHRSRGVFVFEGFGSKTRVVGLDVISPDTARNLSAPLDGSGTVSCA